MGLAQLMRKVSPVFQAAAADDESNLDLLSRLAISKIIKPPPPAQPLPQLDPRRYPMDERLPDGRSVTEAVGGLSVPGFGAPSSGSMDPQTAQDPPPAPQLETRPRRVFSEAVEEQPEPNLNEPFGTTGEVFGSTRPRRTQPRDYVADDEAYLRDLRNAPVERSRLKSFGLAALRGLANGPGGAIGGGLVGLLDPELYGRGKRNREIQKAEANLEGSLQQQKIESGQRNEASLRDYRAAQAQRALNPVFAPRVVETPDGPVSVSGTTAQPILDPAGQRIKGKPEAAKPKIVERINPRTGKREQYRTVEGNADVLVMVEGDDGLMAPPAAERAARATLDQRQYSRGRDQQEDARRESEFESQRAAAETAVQEAEAAASDHLAKRRQADEARSALEAQLLSLGEVGPDSPVRIQLETQIKLARDEASYRQREADTAFAEARKAKSEIKKRSQLSPRVTRTGRGVQPKVSAAKLNSLLGIQ